MKKFFTFALGLFALAFATVAVQAATFERTNLLVPGEGFVAVIRVTAADGYHIYTRADLGREVFYDDELAAAAVGADLMETRNGRYSIDVGPDGIYGNADDTYAD